MSDFIVLIILSNLIDFDDLSLYYWDHCSIEVAITNDYWSIVEMETIIKIIMLALINIEIKVKFLNIQTGFVAID